MKCALIILFAAVLGCALAGGHYGYGGLGGGFGGGYGGGYGGYGHYPVGRAFSYGSKINHGHGHHYGGYGGLGLGGYGYHG